MARKKRKGTMLELFSGRKASLNRVISKILEKKSPLIAYDVLLQIRGIKGFRHTDFRTVYRRMQALEQQGWIIQRGTRQAQPGWDSKLYELSLRGKAALRLDEKSLEDFLLNATDEQLLKFIEVFG